MTPSSHPVRQPAVAGRFYPGDTGQLDSEVDAYLESGAAVSTEEPQELKALIAPHAGYIYSGPVAGSAFSRLRPLRSRITRVVLVGPSHTVAFKGIAASSAQSFRTPLGEIPVDAEAVSSALQLPQVLSLDEAHLREHCLEVELPFLQKALDAFSLAPFVVGDATAEEVGELIELLWGGEETLVVVSSDLSHYLDYDSAVRMDCETSEAIEDLSPGKISRDGACGRIPIQGLLLAARKHGLRARLLDRRNSGDTAGPRDRVVGYGAYAFG